MRGQGTLHTNDHKRRLECGDESYPHGTFTVSERMDIMNIPPDEATSAIGVNAKIVTSPVMWLIYDTSSSCRTARKTSHRRSKR